MTNGQEQPLRGMLRGESNDPGPTPAGLGVASAPPSSGAVGKESHRSLFRQYLRRRFVRLWPSSASRVLWASGLRTLYIGQGVRWTGALGAHTTGSNAEPSASKRHITGRSPAQFPRNSSSNLLEGSSSQGREQVVEVEKHLLNFQDLAVSGSPSPLGPRFRTLTHRS
jgi:hypothetical protein